jgi:flagellar protein FlgJ
MIRHTDLTSTAAFDLKGIGELRQSAKSNDPAALKTAATQFEAMFINMMMKSMRDATPQDSLMGSEQGKMFTGMLDQQTSQEMAKRGTGLADVLIRQLAQSSQLQAPGSAGASSATAGSTTPAAGSGASTAGGIASAAPSPGLFTFSPISERASAMLTRMDVALAAAGVAANMATSAATSMATSAATLAAAPAEARTQAPHVRAFQDKLTAHAEEASRTTGIPAKFMLGQAALESGWGKHEIKGRDGTTSYNLFGIKAGGSWTGKVAEAVTTEYVNGVPHTKVEKFRAYDSYAESFRDYAKLITENKRYDKVVANAGDASSFAQGLQRAGYATDPNYAAKLTRIINQSFTI